MDEFYQKIEQVKKEHLYNPKLQQKYKCSKCKDTGFLCRINENGHEVFYRCECYAMNQARKIIKCSGISAEFQKKTFDNFITNGKYEQLTNAKTKAIQYVDNFYKIEHDKYNSIMFCGQVGAGKTHLGIAICGALMKEGIAITYMAYRNIITKLKQNIIDEEIYNRELNQYISARVLYIDDLLKGRLTEADINIMYEIINHRYMNNMPMIISTEKTPDELLKFDEAIGSRMIEMCRYNIIYLHGKELNYRLYHLS